MGCTSVFSAAEFDTEEERILPQYRVAFRFHRILGECDLRLMGDGSVSDRFQRRVLTRIADLVSSWPQPSNLCKATCPSWGIVR